MLIGLLHAKRVEGAQPGGAPRRQPAGDERDEEERQSG